MSHNADSRGMAGAGLTGCETALQLAQQGRQVVLIDMLAEDEIAQDTSVAGRVALMDLLKKHGVEFRTEVTLTEITPKSVVVTDRSGGRTEIPVDSVVLALGMKPLLDEARSFQGLAAETYTIGDCRSPREIRSAIHEGFNVTADL